VTDWTFTYKPPRIYPLVTVSVVMYDGGLPERSDQAELPDAPSLFAAACLPAWPVMWPVCWL